MDFPFVIQPTQPHHIPALVALQERVFPSLSPEERMGTAHYEAHLRLFPEGQFVATHGDQVVGMSTTMRYHYTEEDHTFLDISGNMMLTTHEPDGQWMYDLDIGVHPDFRKKGIAKAIYEARIARCAELGLAGILTVGMPNGYAQHASEMDLDTYFAGIVAGNIIDPTVSAQQKVGFTIIKLIHNYLSDPQCGNGGVLMKLRI